LKNSVNHTCNVLPRIQAEGAGPATFPGRRLAKVLALGFLGAILGLSLSWLSDNPFALTFQSDAVLIAVSLMVAAVAALMMLFRSRRVLARIVAGSCIVVGLRSVFLVGILAVRNHILWRSRLTKESWQQDVRYLSNLIVITVFLHPRLRVLPAPDEDVPRNEPISGAPRVALCCPRS
jgi:hypothetical protein